MDTHNKNSQSSSSIAKPLGSAPHFQGTYAKILSSSFWMHSQLLCRQLLLSHLQLPGLANMVFHAPFSIPHQLGAPRMVRIAPLK